MFSRGKCVEWKTRNLIKVDANRLKNEGIDYGNDLNGMIRGREYDQIRGEMNFIEVVQELD